MSMLTGHVSGIVTLLLLMMFIGIFKWAWSSKRTADFEALSNLPLEENEDLEGGQQ